MPTMAPRTTPPDDRIRVAFCIDNLNIGGTELNAVRLAERLDKSRFLLRIVSLQADGPLADRYRAAGVPLDVFSPGSIAGPNGLREGVRLRDHLRRHGIEVFHAHDMYSNLFGCFWARLSGAKVIASRRWQGVPAPSRGWKIASRVPYRIAHVALANSPRVGDILHELDRVPRRRIAVVSNFLDERTFDPPSEDVRNAVVRELGLAGARATIGVVANLRPVKDHAMLLQALARLHSRWPDVKVVLVGEGPSREELQRLAEQLGVAAQVVFAGRRPNDPNLNFLFDIGVLCSKREGLPNSVLEAMAAGIPVVATDVGGVGDAVVDGETGHLVPAGDAGRLAMALDSLLANPDRARAMGAAGRARAATMYSPEAALTALESLYLRLAPRALADSRSADPTIVGSAI
jgi:glycosyltransferase involved in cell wall biosynthesis